MRCEAEAEGRVGVAVKAARTELLGREIQVGADFTPSSFWAPRFLETNPNQALGAQPALSTLRLSTTAVSTSQSRQLQSQHRQNAYETDKDQKAVSIFTSFTLSIFPTKTKRLRKANDSMEIFTDNDNQSSVTI